MVTGYRLHIRNHPQLQREKSTPPNKLLSKRSSIDDSNGVFEFNGIVADDQLAVCPEISPDSDDDSYYSDYAYDREYGSGGVLSSSSDEDDNSDDLDDDISDSTFNPSGEEDDDNVMDYVDRDSDED